MIPSNFFIKFNSNLVIIDVVNAIHINFAFNSTIFTIIIRSIVFTLYLFICVFIKHTGNLTSFIHILGFIFLIYYLWLETIGIIFHFDVIVSKTIFEIIQEGSLFFRLFYIYATITLVLFFFGITERFFLSKKVIIEFPILLICLHFGGLFVIRLHTIIDLLIALEIVTLASYVFIAFERQNRFSAYAAVQYFILGSLPSAILLLAFSLFYLQGGSIAIQDLDLIFNTIAYSYTLVNIITNQVIFFIDYININSISEGIPFVWIKSFHWFSIIKLESILISINPVNSRTIIALIFLFFNFIFKLTAAPFHVWAPSVYGKASIASVTFLSIYSKVIIFFLLYKVMTFFLQAFAYYILNFFILIGVISILVGMIGAFSEKNIKQFFVYSSIGHVGFILIGISLNTIESASATFHYLAVYIGSSFIIWFILLTIGRNFNHITHFSQLKNIDPILARIFAFLIFSISGIPPLGGFFIKLDILSVLLSISHFFINYLLFFGTVVSFFYYLRVIKIIFFDNSLNRHTPTSMICTKIGYYWTVPSRLWIISFIIIFLGMYLFFVQKPLLAIQSTIIESF